MRIRLRVPTDGEEKSDGLRGWYRGLLAAFRKPPGIPKSNCHQPDKRWLAHGDTKYFFEGRHCRNNGGAWQSEYVFSVLSEGELQQVRVVLPEAPIGEWEQQHNQRMTEDGRLRLARDTMEALIGLRRRPSAITVSAEAIAAFSKS